MVYLDPCAGEAPADERRADATLREERRTGAASVPEPDGPAVGFSANCEQLTQRWFPSVSNIPSLPGG
jgi:hypothetical protein